MRLALRGLWWRRGSSFVVLLTIVLAVAGAVAGPLFSRAAAESALRVRLEQAPVGDRGIRIASVGAATTGALDRLTALFPAALAGYFPTHLPSLQLHSPVVTQHGVDGVTDLTWRPGVCGHLVLVTGHCPSGRSEAIVSSRTIDPAYGVVMGGSLQVDAPQPLRIVGVYRPADLTDPYWFGQNYFDAHLYQGAGEGPDTLDSVFVDDPVLTSGANPLARLRVDFFLAPEQIRLDDLPRLSGTTDSMLKRYPPTAWPGTQTQLPQLLTAAAHDRDVLNEGCLIVTAELVLLGWLVLHHIITGTSEARAPEVAAAKLRGWRPRAVVRFALAETAVLLGAGVPLGLLGGYLATRLLAVTALTSGTPVLVRWAPVLAGAVAATGAAAAAVVASWQVLRRPILAQWRRADSRLTAGGRVGLVRDLLIAVLASAGLVVLRLTGALSGGRPQVAGLLAPALFILAVAMLGTRLVPAAGRLAVRHNRASPHVAAFLAIRQVARRRDGLRAGALLGVAIGLAVFAVAEISVIQANEQTRARAEVGAAQVVPVQPHGTTLVQAVDRADPDGRWAMAVAQWQPVGGNLVGQVYAVQTSRLATVAFGQPAWGDSNLRAMQRELRPPNAPSVAFSGDQVRVSITASGSRLGSPAPSLAVALADRHGSRVVEIGPPLHPGSATYTWRTPCARPCRLVDVEVYRAVDDSGPMTGTVIVHDIEQRTREGWRPVPAHLGVAGDWRAGAVLTDGYVRTRADATGLRMDFSVQAGGWPAAEVADYPRPLPVVVGAHAQSMPGPLYVGQLTDVVPLDQVDEVAILPRALDVGVLTDLDLAAAQLPAFDTAVDQVWLSRTAPPDALERLRAAGLSTGAADTLSARLLALRSQGPAQTLNLLRFASMVAALLALAAAALSTALTARRRAFELAALRTVGIRRATLLRASVVEQFLLLAIGTVLGTAAALVAFAIGASSVPQFSDATPVPLTFAADPLALAGFIAGVVVLILVGAFVAGRLLLRAAVPALLREAAP